MGAAPGEPLHGLLASVQRAGAGLDGGRARRWRAVWEEAAERQRACSHGDRRNKVRRRVSLSLGRVGLSGPERVCSLSVVPSPDFASDPPASGRVIFGSAR